MRFRLKLILLVVACGFLAVACKTDATRDAQISNYETPGNLKGTGSPGCVKLTSLNDMVTPPDIYAGMVDCANAGLYTDGAYLFALAGSYTYFDSLRVSDKTAHQAHSVLLRNSMEALPVDKKVALWQEIKNTLGNPTRLPAVCKEISAIGVARYYPAYMVQHGMAAVLGAKPGDGLVQRFDTEAAWGKTLDSYLHCP